MSGGIKWARLCGSCREVFDRYSSGSSGALRDPWRGVVEDVVRACGCALEAAPDLSRLDGRACEWFAGCSRTALYLVEHPVLEDVPTCSTCVERVGVARVRGALAVVSSVDLERVVEAWLEARGRYTVGEIAAVYRHLDEGIDNQVGQWAVRGLLECGVDGCSTCMLDPFETHWLIEHRPGLDVAPVCTGCLEAYRLDVERRCARGLESLDEVRPLYVIEPQAVRS
jgi:hypothetical protein